jgi:hypothetical protein
MEPPCLTRNSKAMEDRNGFVVQKESFEAGLLHGTRFNQQDNASGTMPGCRLP